MNAHQGFSGKVNLFFINFLKTFHPIFTINVIGGTVENMELLMWDTVRECNEYCNCALWCGNRVAQKGAMYPVEVRFCKFSNYHLVVEKIGNILLVDNFYVPRKSE